MNVNKEGKHREDDHHPLPPGWGNAVLDQESFPIH